ncbi:MAG TPA: TIGR01440 family protein [Bacillales bacterium]|nr:TIGR01440 family protein [Bacillales bacterium]
MSEVLATIRGQVQQVLSDLHEAMVLSSEHLLVVGTSTSEVIGKSIGTSGTAEVATSVYEALREYSEETGVRLAFQCCEHLNRAVVVEKETADHYGYEVVSAVPIRSAGGSMATYAYHQMKNPVLVESVCGDAGIDIGDTFIGMHLKSVVVPVRSKIDTIGKAHVTLARTRPKLIGGARAVYRHEEKIERF